MKTDKTCMKKNSGAKKPVSRTGVRIFGVIAVLFVSGIFAGPGLSGEFASGQTGMTTENLKDSNLSDNTTQSVTKKDLVVTRVFDAPVELVWKAWKDPEQVKRWWGPIGFTSPVARIDFREGGTSLVCMRSPAGQDFYNTWAYRRIVPMKLIEFILDWADKNGNRVDPSTMGLPPNLPRDVRHVVTFKAVGDKKTEMTVTEYGYTSDQVFDLSKAGLEQCLDKMAASFAKA